MRGCLPGVSPSSGAYRATFPQRGKAFPAGWGHPALHRNFTAIFPPASLSYQCAHAARTPYLLFLIYYLNCPSPAKPHLPHNSPGTLPRPKNAPPGRFFPAVRKTRGAGCSRPRWCTDPQHPGKLQQKNSLTFSVRLYLGALCSGLSRGLTKPHWGFVVGRYAKRPTRPVLVPDGAPIRSIPENCNKKTALRFP